MGARFQALFHSPLGVLFTFPSRYSFAIGHGRVLSLGGRSPLLRAGFHVPGPTRGHGLGAFGGPRTGLSPAAAGLPMPFRFPEGLSLRPGLRGPRPPCPATPARQRPRAHRSRGFGLCPVSLAATPGVSVDFLSSGYLDVSVPPVAAPGPMYSVPGQVGTTPPGFPHSGIRGSKAVCASPRLIAACHALRRLPMPRHPPCALGIFSQRPADLIGPRIRRNSSR